MRPPGAWVRVALALSAPVAGLEAQVARPGATRLMTPTVVISVLPDTLDGVHLDAKLRPDNVGPWTHVSARFDPSQVSAWTTSVEQSLGDTIRSPILTGLGGWRGLALVHAPGPGGEPSRLHWLFHRIDQDKPLALAADLDFSKALLRALRDAVPHSAIDSAAFRTALVMPLMQWEMLDSLDPAPRHIPQPKYPRKLQMQSLDGLVLVRFVIDEKGAADMSTFETLWASHEGFVPPVREAIFRGRFRPARYEGKPVRRRVYQTVQFRVGGGEGEWQ